MSNSNEDWYNPPGNPHQPFQSNNPYQQSQEEQNVWGQGALNPAQDSQSTNQGYAAPPGPPPSHGQQHAPAQAPAGGQPGLPPRRAGTFEETDFVPADERGEQREALEQFEMSKGSESQEDRDIATLQREYPAVDGSLVAALYSDSKSVSATREMLAEIASSQGS
jgi:hypothetical protein